MTSKLDAKKRPRGRPSKPIPKIDASAERIARAVFAAAKKPDPSHRIGKAKPPVETAAG